MTCKRMSDAERQLLFRRAGVRCEQDFRREFKRLSSQTILRPNF